MRGYEGPCQILSHVTPQFTPPNSKTHSSMSIVFNKKYCIYILNNMVSGFRIYL